MLVSWYLGTALQSYVESDEAAPKERLHDVKTVNIET